MKLKHLSTAMILATLPATGVLQQLWIALDSQCLHSFNLVIILKQVSLF